MPSGVYEHKPLSEETKRKIGGSLKGKPKGIKRSEETVRRSL